MKLRFTRTALKQIEQALSYIAERSPSGARRVSDRISATVDLVKHYPHAGQATSRKHVRRIVLTPYPYVIFYRHTATEVVVMRFRHAARKPL